MRGGAAVVGALLLAACGSSAAPSPWRSGHPDPGSLSLLDTSQAGSCAAHVPYPGQAPAAISFQGMEYIQVGRVTSSATSINGAVEIDHTGDWSFWIPSATLIYLLAPAATYTYAPGNC